MTTVKLTPKEMKILSIFSFTVLVILYGWLIGSIMFNTLDAKSYNDAAICKGTPQRSCKTYISATTTHVFTEGAGRTQRLFGLFKTLDGDNYKTQVPYASLWQSLDEGAPVKLEIWHNKVTTIYFYSSPNPTSDNPEWKKENGTSALIAITVLLTIVVGILLAALKLKKSVPNKIT